MRPKVLLAVAAIPAFPLGTAAPAGWPLEATGAAGASRGGSS